MTAIINALLYVLANLHFLIIGVAGGIIVGAIPGLSGSTGIILMLPFLIYIDPPAALIMMSGLFCGSMFGGSIASILVSTPGTPSAAATALDGYPLAKKGEAGKALGVSLVASTLGGIFSTLCLIFLAPQLAKIALKFGPPEYFALMIFGLTIMASVSSASLTKGFLSGFFGLLLSMVGLNPTLGTERFTFGVIRLLTGFSMMPVLIGLFAVSEVFAQLELMSEGKIVRLSKKHKIGSIMPTKKEMRGLWKVILGSSVIGTIIGIIPATGGSIASFMAYNEAKRFSKEPDSFGTGNLAGIAAPEAANNATTGGAMIPLLTLGIPGDVVTSVMLGALMIIGVQPGPLLFSQSPQIITDLFIGFLFAQFIMVALGYLSIRASNLILRVPLGILYPTILCLCLLGAYSLGNSVYDVMLALVFGIVGYFMKKYGFSAPSVILGLILGPIAEQELSRALIISHGDWTVLIRSPLAIMFYAFAVASIFYSFRSFKRSKTK
ncbi:MAG TPA: tripartite tricarboxylate transporter permease [Rectinema sp.]|jgi:putative tricarboxylic transport membrane protein|nr:tripartite tricarboxylate transporter permease [Rectinema sp.]HPB62270.1 tripartite tricarboxylate transporter permease [Rectinema sp.]